MSIRLKTLLLIAGTTVVLLILLYSLSLAIVLGRFAELEKRDARRALEQALNALGNEIGELDTFNHDWAAWDDTYAFILDRNPEYLEANLRDETFSGAKISLMMFVNRAGEVVFAKAYDWRRLRRLPLPAEVMARIRAGERLLQPVDEELEHSGLFLASPWPLLLSSHPILTSTLQGPGRGSLIMGRRLDTEEIAELAETTRLSLEFRRLDGELPEDYRVVLPALKAGADGVVHPLDSARIAAYGLVRDYYGEAALVLRVDSPREAYGEGVKTVRYLILSLLGVGAVFCAAVMALLERWVLRRLSALSRGVAGIGQLGDLSARVEVQGRDELASLGGSINAMLGQLKQAEERHRALTSAVPDLILRVRGDGTVLDANRPADPLLNEEFSDQASPLSRVLPAELAARSLEEIDAALAAGRMGGFEYRHPFPDGTRDFEVRIVVSGPGEVLQIIRDVTERKKEILLREIHHRVKNNLQVISSLLYLQSQQAGDPRLARILEENRNRIRAIALIHEKLYQSAESGAVRFAAYLRDLANNLLIAYGASAARVRLEQAVGEELALGMDTAILCGLIISELVSNSLKHAFPAERAGCIRIELNRQGAAAYRLVVADDGVGLPPGFRLENSRSMGLQLVQLFARQLGAALDVAADGGTRFELEFKDALG